MRFINCIPLYCHLQVGEMLYVVRVYNYRVKQATYEQTQTQSLYQYKITTRWRPLSITRKCQTWFFTFIVIEYCAYSLVYCCTLIIKPYNLSPLSWFSQPGQRDYRRFTHAWCVIIVKIEMLHSENCFADLKKFTALTRARYRSCKLEQVDDVYFPDHTWSPH